MEKLTDRIKELAICLGAADVGITTTRTLACGPPSTDLSYVLPGAASAVTFLVPMDQALIEPYLGKKDRLSHEKDNIRASKPFIGL